MTDVKEIFDLMPALTDEDKALIIKAYAFAEKAHEGQKRHSGESYFTHVFNVAKNIATLGMDTKTVVAGLIHDTLEDTPTSEKTIEKEFGKDILFLVKGVTKLGKLKYRGRERHVESLRKFFVAVAEDVRVLIIKFADRLHNIQTLEHVREDKRERIALETIKIYAPLANRLGMGKLKGELEDYAFPYAYPKEYKMVEDLLAQKAGVTPKHLEDAHADLKEELDNIGLKDAHIEYRIKHKYSLYKKLLKYNMDIDKIYDFVALRVVVPTIEDCYRVLGIIHSMWKPLPGRIKDYIAFPKPNGYQSLHTTVLTHGGGLAEIQIRTEEMDEESEYGIASHFSYKEGIKRKEGEALDKKFEWMGQLKELQKIVAEPGDFLEHLEMDFFKDRIFILTPGGDVVDLPEESSPLDFAYAIHSDIGDHTFGAKVNGKFVSLDTKLTNGNIVEIITKEKSHPVNKWLEYTKTTLAKRHIRAYMNKD